jgi:hypothetical protein
MSAAATTSSATVAATSAMTSAAAAAFCVSSACKNGGQEDNGTEFEFWHGNLERGSASYRCERLTRTLNNRRAMLKFLA